MSEGRHPDADQPTPGTPLAWMESEWRNRMFKSIEKLFSGQEEIKKDVTAIRVKMAEDDHGGEIRSLRTQLEKQQEKIEKLERFRIQMMTVFLVMNFLLGTAIAVVALLKR